MASLSPSLLRRPLLGAGLLAGLLALAAPMRADDSSSNEPPTLTERTSDMFSRIKALWDAKNWNAVVAELDTALSAADPDSYDAAMILDTKAKVEVEMNHLDQAIDPWERALQLADSHSNYFQQKDLLQMVYLLGNLYSVEGGTAKGEAQREDYAKAIDYIARYLRTAPHKWVNDQQFDDAHALYVQLLLNQAAADPKNIDKAKLAVAAEECHKGMMLTIRPKDQFYELYIYALEQEGDYEDAAKYTEALLRMSPKNKTYWGQLVTMYDNLAGGAKTEGDERAYYARAVNTFAHARALGYLDTPKDNYTLITIYYNAGQFSEATRLLAAGLRDGDIAADDLKNWQLLAYSYQQTNQMQKAIEAYRDAEKYFPDNGNIDVDIAAVYTELNDIRDTYEAYETAVSKPQLDHAYETYQALAYDAFEMAEDSGDMKLYRRALQVLNNSAQKYPDAAAKDTNWKLFHDAVVQSIAAETARKAASTAAIHNVQ